MSTYVLIHGAWGGSWCWDAIVPALERSGHRVLAIDLPGRAGDTRPYPQITLASHVETVRRVVETHAEPVLLVGHSMGGVILSECAEAFPDRIRTLVYLTAFLLESGQSLFDAAGSDLDSLVGPYLMVDQAAASVSLKSGAPLKEIAFGSCTDAEVERVRPLLIPEPLLPMATPIRTTPSRFGRVARVYVECTQDRTISIGLQRRMVATSGCKRVITMDSDHSPFLSDPVTLTRHLTAQA